MLTSLEYQIRRVIRRTVSSEPEGSPAAQILEIDDLLAGETDGQVIDCLLDCRLDLMAERDAEEEVSWREWRRRQWEHGRRRV